MAHRFHPTILREYDIRGIVGETLSANDAYAIGRSFATILHRENGTNESDIAHRLSRDSDIHKDSHGAIHVRGDGFTDTHANAHHHADSTHIAPSDQHPSDQPCVVVGYDGRLSSPMLEAALVEGLIDSGVHVIRIGLSSTPMLYYAQVSEQKVIGGIQVTGSHNPANHNGFKIILRGLPFFGGDLQRLGEIAAAGDWVFAEKSDVCVPPQEGHRAKLGHVITRNILHEYVGQLRHVLDEIHCDDLARLRIGWDAGNGAGGPALQLLTDRLPGEHHVLFPEVDGRFPNHHPDPTIEENLADLRAIVSANNLDFGVAFDGDADRIGVIDGQGRIVDADQLMMIFAQDMLPRHPGARVVVDIKASQHVSDTVRMLGGVPEMAKSGHAHIKSKMNAIGALLGGETSGHINFADDYYGFDDAFYAALRLILASHRLGQSVTELRDAMPVMVNTPELRFAVPAERKFAAIDEVRDRLLADGVHVNTMDGVRVTGPDGWWLLRASNTQEALTARAESKTPEGLERLVDQIDAQLAQSGLSRHAPVTH